MVKVSHRTKSICGLSIFYLLILANNEEAKFAVELSPFNVWCAKPLILSLSIYQLYVFKRALLKLKVAPINPMESDTSSKRSADPEDKAMQLSKLGKAFLLLVLAASMNSCSQFSPPKQSPLDPCGAKNRKIAHIR